MTAAAEAITQPCPDDRDVTAGPWVDAILLAARHLGVAVSPELMRNASAWADRAGSEQAIIDIALSAGLAGTFAGIAVDGLSEIMLPALVAVSDKHIGVITRIDGGRMTLSVWIDGRAVEYTVPTQKLMAKLPQRRVLLVRERDIVRDSRLDRYLSQRPRSWLTGIFTSNWPTLIELGLGSLFANLLAIGTSLFAMQVWDRVVPAQSLNTLWVLTSGLVLALALEFLMRTARLSIVDHFGKQADLKLSAMFFARVLNIRNDARPKSPGTLISQLRDLEQIRELLTSSALGVMLDLPFVVAFLFIIWLLGGPLVWVPLVAIPFLIVPGFLAQYPLARLSTEGMSESALRNTILMEAIYRAEDIKILQAEPRFRKLWNGTNQVSGEIGLKQRKLAGLLVNFAQAVQQLAYAGVVIAGVYGILDGSLSFGAVLACSILTSRTIAPLGQISAILSRLQNARAGKKGLDSLLDLPIDHDPEKPAYHKPTLVGRYRFENVAYAYEAEARPALVIPGLAIEPGERVAILGRVGAGKSTFLRLAAGLATPGQGTIVFNGTAMDLIDAADIRRDVGVLLQETSLFYGTLRHNLLIGNPLASDEQILEAMQVSCADQLLLHQPHGLDLTLREGGIGLSGGQKQALMLARLVLRSPSIVILDEPTASLDEGTELQIIDRMKTWLGERTLIVATHRFALLALVDRIIVVDGGRVVLNGPKEEVLRVLAGKGPVQPANRSGLEQRP